ncbi:MAG: S8 family serine peptidase [Actinobacteria bacterium]|nr:S8 family serine peptidase [Actinomycetota bacterium]
MPSPSFPADAITTFSNFGATSVDVAAPGENIYTCDNTGSYEFVDGTSASTAYASGLAGLILALDSTLTAAQLKAQITNSVDVLAGLNNKVATEGGIPT